MWPGTADKYVPLIYGKAVKWLLRVVNIKLISFWRQCHAEEKGVKKTRMPLFDEKGVSKEVHAGLIVVVF